nr:hypothetical protein [uncultured Ottowia sp.]
MGEMRRAQQMMNAIQGATQALDCEKRTLIELNPARRPRKDDEISVTSAQAVCQDRLHSAHGQASGLI